MGVVISSSVGGDSNIVFEGLKNKREIIKLVNTDAQYGFSGNSIGTAYKEVNNTVEKRVTLYQASKPCILKDICIFGLSYSRNLDKIKFGYDPDSYTTSVSTQQYAYDYTDIEIPIRPCMYDSYNSMDFNLAFGTISGMSTQIQSGMVEIYVDGDLLYTQSIIQGLCQSGTYERTTDNLYGSPIGLSIISVKDRIELRYRINWYIKTAIWGNGGFYFYPTALIARKIFETA